MLVSVFVRNKGSYEHVSNTEWVSRQSCLNLARTILPSRLDFCLWGLDEERNLEKKSGYATQIVRVAFWLLLSASKCVKFNSDTQNATLARDFQIDTIV